MSSGLVVWLLAGFFYVCGAYLLAQELVLFKKIWKDQDT
jgi:hypothetical protein